MRQIQIQGVGKETHILMGVHTKTFWKEHGSGRGRELMPFLVINAQGFYIFKNKRLPLANIDKFCSLINWPPGNRILIVFQFMFHKAEVYINELYS